MTTILPVQGALTEARTATGGAAGGSALVVVEAGARLAAEPFGSDHAAQQRRRRVVGILELGVQRLEDRETRVEANQVEQLEGTHREVAAALHRGVDVVARRDAGVEQPDRVVEVREQQRIDDEAS